MNPQELSSYLAEMYKRSSLIKRFGSGGLTADLASELESLLLLNLGKSTTEQQAPVDVELPPLVGSDSFGDLAFHEKRVYSKSSGQWRVHPGLSSAHRELRFLIERPERGYTPEEINNLGGFGSSIANIQNGCARVMRGVNECSKVYRGSRIGRNPTRYRVEKIG